MKRILYLYFLIGMGGTFVWAAPVTQVSVTHPKTDVAVSHPKTSVDIYRPKTSVEVSRPRTSVEINHPKTEVVVTHPKTSVVVERPTTMVSGEKAGAQKETGLPKAKGSAAKQASSKNAASNASAKPSMMSTYQPPQATNFKAAKTGGGESGMGNKVNEAEKDAAAASFKLPKGEEVSAEGLKQAKNSGLKSNLAEIVKEKTK